MPLTPTSCPKAMTYGPCGGVRGDDSCEVDDRRCPFVSNAITDWAGEPHSSRTVDVPRVVIDHRPTGDDVADRRILTGLSDLGVAVLLGDHLDDPPTIDRVATVERTCAEGVTTIATITGRGRTVAERSRLVTGYVEAGVAAVLCLTGDHPAARLGEYDDVEFVTEGTRLADEARRLGAIVAVAESPGAPPRSKRSARLRTKQDAGADFVILNHAGALLDAVSFAKAARAEGVSLPMIAPVPVMTDRRSVDALAQFPGVKLCTADVERIIESTDPVRTGVKIAVASARRLLASGLFVGVNLSGVATGDGAEARSRLMQRIATELTVR